MEDLFALELDRQIFLNMSAIMEDIAGEFDSEINCSPAYKVLARYKTSSIASTQLRIIEIIKDDGIMEVL